MCSLTPFVLIAFAAGTVVSTLTGSDLAGWLAALTAVAVVATAQRVSGTVATCAAPASPRARRSKRQDDP